MVRISSLLAVLPFAVSAMAATWPDGVGPIPRTECACVCEDGVDSDQITAMLAADAQKVGRVQITLTDNHMCAMYFNDNDLFPFNPPNKQIMDEFAGACKTANAKCTSAKCDKITCGAPRRTKIEL